MHVSRKYQVTEVRQVHNGGKGRYIVLSAHPDKGGPTPKGCIELQVDDPDVVPEFAIDSVHTVTITPVTPVMRAAVPAGPIHPGPEPDPVPVPAVPNYVPDAPARTRRP